MTKTTNYQLNQWAKSDRVMMDDFNADNAKIDAALKAAAEASPYVKLLSVTLDTQCSHWSIDVSGIDLRNYRKLEIYPRLKGDTDQWPTLYTDNANSMGDVPLNWYLFAMTSTALGRNPSATSTRQFASLPLPV